MTPYYGKLLKQRKKNSPIVKKFMSAIDFETFG